MKIAMLTNNYKPYMGGVPISIEHLAEALRAQGHEVWIFAPTYKEQVEEAYVIRYPSFPIQIAKAPVPNVFSRIFEEKIVELGIDVIHVHHPALVGNIALMLQKQYGIPVVFTYHTRIEAYLHYVKPAQWLESATGVVERYMNWFCNRCDLVAVPTEGIKKSLEQRGVVSPMAVLPTGVKEEAFFPDAVQVKAIRNIYKGDADYLLCSVSRIAKEKNLDFQLKALKRLKEMMQREGKTYRYILIGDGPERERFWEKVKAYGLEQEVSLTGRIENEQMAAYQKACDAFLFSSKSETQGIVILEAMAAGNPVIAVKASGIEDMVENGENGYLTEENAEIFAEQILNVLWDGKLWERLSLGAYVTATKYSENQIAQIAAEAYNRTICEKEYKERNKKQFKEYLWNH